MKHLSFLTLLLASCTAEQDLGNRVTSADAAMKPNDAPVQGDSGTEAKSDVGASDAPIGPSGSLRVFVTRDVFPGNFRIAEGQPTGAKAGDQICARAAAAARLGGTWIAWLGGQNGETAYQRLQGTGPWYLVDRTTLVFSSKNGPNPGSILAGPLEWINKDEFGVVVTTDEAWTGTVIPQDEANYRNSFACGDWSELTSVGVSGDPQFRKTKPQLWSDAHEYNCSGSLHLYCFEQ